LRLRLGGPWRVVFYTIDKTGRRVAVSVRYSAYDLLEYLSTQRMVRDPEMRSKLVEGTLIALEIAKVKGSNMELREYVEKELGISWEEFKQKVRADIEASIERYIKEIDSTDGSILAKHIYLREHARGSLHDAWLVIVSQEIANAVPPHIARMRDSVTVHQDVIKGLRDFFSWVRKWPVVNEVVSAIEFALKMLPGADRFLSMSNYDFSPYKLDVDPGQVKKYASRREDSLASNAH